MNRYHIEVINSNQLQKRKVEADFISWSEAGLYEFSKKVVSKEGRPKNEVVAYYPVSRTVIESIEYDIETDLEND